ncbi:phospholipid-transporting ATPase ABCA1-like [Venturia canescens]|uniref:phospholipid-transporting ATPase ABCA1-like n=1 Tax=Venturia canescens TaxID=32260 RepID=UPI001C9C2AE3|nr:phospholipid-transporting ATPase ABCA1-like [Venturia canescens]
MAEYFRIFKLLMKKNMIVRKKHWKMSLFVEIMIPLLLFLLGQIVRASSGSDPVKIQSNTYHQIDYPNRYQINFDNFQIRYTPVNPLTTKLMNDTVTCMEIKKSQLIGTKSEESMLAEFSNVKSNYPFMECLGVVFEAVDDSTMPKDFRYKLRTSTGLPKELFEEEENGDGAELYFAETALTRTQTCLDQALIKEAANLSSVPVEFSIQQMPYPPYVYVDKATILAGQAFGELARFAFLVVLCVEVTYPSNEKYIGINILMSVNGVKNHQNLFSWLISGVLFSTVYLSPIIVMLKYDILPNIVPYLIYGNSFIIWLVLTVHACHVIAFGMHVTAYLWKPSHGVFASFMVTMLMDIINKYATGQQIRHLLIYLGILSPNFLLSRIFNEINSYETRLIGVQWSNLFSTGDLAAPGESCIGVMVLFSLIGTVVHFFMAIYVYSVRPGKYGVAQSPLFFLKKSNKVFHDVEVTELDYDREDRKEFEKVPAGTLTPGIQIRQLKKTYVTNWLRGTKVQALRGIDVDFYKGQITALLGHNGAGKTTMMSILSGLTSSTEGMVFVNGQNVQYELDAVRRNLGLCPQENMVFPDLTVYEQVLFFGMLKAKNKTKKQLDEEVDILLSKVNLSDKKNSIARQLSGGQKRRMCLAMAVIGDASVLILDEPTSGMDAESKREVWDIILKLRGDTTILISTHDMEEADILGDRVAIIHSGKMRSYGTSMFLKKLYGDGQVEVTLSIEPNCDPRKIINEIGLNAQLLSQDEGQVVLAIPLAENLPTALDNLERQKRKLGVTGLSVSIITLEQVFLRVTREHGDETDSSNTPAKLFSKILGFAYFFQTTRAYIAKKIAFTSKNPWNFFFSTILPCIAALIMILDHGGKTPSRKPVSASLDAYSNAHTLCYTKNQTFADKYAISARSFGASSKYIGSNNSLTDALLSEALEDLGTYRNKLIVSSEFNDTEEKPGESSMLKANGFYSGTAYFGIPVTLNMLANTVLKVLTGDEHYRIKLWLQELPDSFAMQMYQSTANSFTLSMALFVFLAPAVALYVTHPLQENLSSVKHLQFMTGASSFSYWLSMYIFDMIQYTVSIILLISTFVIADVSFGTKYYHATEIMIFFLILFMFGASVLPLVYLMSFTKKSMNTCTILLSITPLILSFIDFLLWGLTGTVKSKIYDVFRDIQSRVFLLIPHMSFIYGHVSFFEVVAQNSQCRRMPSRQLEVICQYVETNPCCSLDCHNGICQKSLPYFVENPDFTSLGQSLIWMACSAILFSALIFVLEKRWFERLYSYVQKRRGTMETASGTDELVRQEAELVASEVLNFMLRRKDQPAVTTENIFHVHKLSKSYGNVNAVRGISFRVKQFECFGLLGVNGAGKSTTFRMLTGEEIPRSGSIYLKEFNIETERSKYLGQMGYCPQHDAILEALNAWDHLYLFARLRGIPKNEIKAAVEKWVHKLNLQKCASQPSGTYSGGNKRRLNIAMALIGNPTLVLMDEPTTGVDPAARRSLWNTLKTCQEAGQSIILTSHSMEECEVLCNRLVIMVKGQLVCVGASQELKQRFGAGYNIHVKLNPGSEATDLERIKRRIETTLVCKLIDENTGFIGYHVTDSDATWTIMYSMMNQLKTDYSCIEDFAVLSSTLEQLFIQFARAPNEDDEADQANGIPKRRWWQRKQTRGSRV